MDISPARFYWDSTLYYFRDYFALGGIVGLIMFAMCMVGITLNGLQPVPAIAAVLSLFSCLVGFGVRTCDMLDERDRALWWERQEAVGQEYDSTILCLYDLCSAWDCNNDCWEWVD